MNKKKLIGLGGVTLIVVFSVIFLGGKKDETKTIGPIGPAVLFDPASGEITPIQFEGPDQFHTDSSPNYTIWIEPSDPEFEFRGKFAYPDNSEYGIQLMGTGEDLFNQINTREEANNKGLNKERWNNELYEAWKLGNSDFSKRFSYALEKIAEDKTSFYISTERGDCLIQILEFVPILREGQDRDSGPRPRAWTLTFDWKSIEK